jgi:CBS domain-containing protein
MQVRDGMSTEVLTIEPTRTLREAAASMAGRHIGACVVADPARSAICILTERDILDAVGAGADPDAELAGTHATCDLVVASPEWSLEQAAAAMVRGGFRHLVVLHGDRVAGILAMRDIVRCWVRNQVSPARPAATVP